MRAHNPCAWLLVTVALIATCHSGGAQELAPENLYAQTVPSIMTLRVETKSGEKYVGAAFFALRDNVAVTAWHVIHDAARVTARFSDGTSCEVQGYMDRDEVKDLALIRVEKKGARLLPLALQPPLVGSRTYVIGSPKGYEFSIGDGLLSQIQRVDGFNQYQLSCPFSPGNSGGPILNGRGHVIGIAAWTRNGAQNLNFATPSAEISSLNPDLPLKRWKSTPAKRAIASTADKRRSSPEAENADTAAELKRLFQKSAGEQITVTIQKDGGQEKFTFTVPNDFVK